LHAPEELLLWSVQVQKAGACMHQDVLELWQNTMMQQACQSSGRV